MIRKKKLKRAAEVAEAASFKSRRFYILGRSLIFLALGLAALWLVLNEFYGTGLITKFIKAAIPSAEEL